MRQSRMSAAAKLFRWRFLALAVWLGFAAATAFAELHTHTFVIAATPVTRLCKTHPVITVNGQFPGPTLYVRDGDTLVVKVYNYAQYNATIHWHGVRQMRTGWADGPEFVTQCPIRPGGSYTYRFTISGQEGTLWWHAHSSWLRASVYGALIIYPKEDASYPFPKPHLETPIILGEWWNKNPIDVLNQATLTGGAPDISDALTINSQPGDLYACSSSETFRVSIKPGGSNLLRVINAALNTEMFFSVANHLLTVVALDASYTKPYVVPGILIAPGQTTDVLLVANQPIGRYYMAARAYATAENTSFINSTTTAILEYEGVGGHGFDPLMPLLPFYNDTLAAALFSVGLKSLASIEHPVSVPQSVDEKLLYTVGMGLLDCPFQSCGGPNGSRFAASMNNISFVLPNSISMLQAHYYGVNGVFTRDFPDNPPTRFDYTARNVPRELWAPESGTRVKVLPHNTAVEIVLQGTSIVTGENHPIHLHGYDFYIVGQGCGNYNPDLHPLTFNLVDPPMRNTVGVPPNGWAAIRFVADNPGVWLLHCHLDAHTSLGLATALLVENGPHHLSTLGAAPLDLPLC